MIWRLRPAVATEPTLSTRELTVGHAGVPVVAGISLDVYPGQAVALLGRNGAGKTTLLMTLAGIYPVLSGGIQMFGSTPPAAFHQRVRSGLGVVTEERAIIRRLTVQENLRLSRSHPDAAFEIFPELRELRGRPAGLLSGGEQQMLALGKVLAAEPSLVVIDELSLGLGPAVVDRLLEAVSVAVGRGAAVILVEQQVARALKATTHAIILAQGQIRLSGGSDDLLGRLDEIEKLYLEA